MPARIVESTKDINVTQRLPHFAIKIHPPLSRSPVQSLGYYLLRSIISLRKTFCRMQIFSHYSPLPLFLPR